jgi:hypothetical protein
MLLCGPPAGADFGFFDLAAEDSTGGFESIREAVQQKQKSVEDVGRESIISCHE